MEPLWCIFMTNAGGRFSSYLCLNCKANKSFLLCQIEKSLTHANKSKKHHSLKTDPFLCISIYNKRQCSWWIKMHAQAWMSKIKSGLVFFCWVLKYYKPYLPSRSHVRSHKLSDFWLGQYLAGQTRQVHLKGNGSSVGSRLPFVWALNQYLKGQDATTSLQVDIDSWDSCGFLEES